MSSHTEGVLRRREGMDYIFNGGKTKIYTETEVQRVSKIFFRRQKQNSVKFSISIKLLRHQNKIDIS